MGRQIPYNNKLIRKIIKEEYLATLSSPRGRGGAEVFKNPTRREWSEINYTFTIRAYLINKRDIVAWSPMALLHGEVGRKLNLSDKALPVVIYGRPGESVSVLISDASKRSIWHESPKAAKFIREHRYIRDFYSRDIKVDYWNEAIVGDWETMVREEVERVFSELAVGPPMKGVFGSEPKFEIGDRVRWQGEVYTVARIEKAKATGKPYYVLQRKPGARLKVVTSTKEFEPLVTEQKMERRGPLGRIIYARAFPSGVPLVMLRGKGADQLKSILTKRYGFRWNPDSFAWESYLDREDLRVFLKKVKLMGYEIRAKKDMRKDYLIRGFEERA